MAIDHNRARSLLVLSVIGLGCLIVGVAHLLSSHPVARNEAPATRPSPPAIPIARLSPPPVLSGRADDADLRPANADEDDEGKRLVVVDDQTTAPVAGARLFGMPSTDNPWGLISEAPLLATSDNLGIAVIPSAAIRALVVAQGYAPALVTSASWKHLPPEVVPQLRLKPNEYVEGTVALPNGEPAVGASVAFIPQSTGFRGWSNRVREVEGYWADDLRSVAYRTITDARGAFRIVLPATSRYLRISSSDGVWVPRNDAEAQGDVVPPDGVYVLRPVVRAEIRPIEAGSGRPVLDADVIPINSDKKTFLLHDLAVPSFSSTSEERSQSLAFVVAEGQLPVRMGFVVRSFEHRQASVDIEWTSNATADTTVEMEPIPPQEMGVLHVSLTTPVPAQSEAWTTVKIMRASDAAARTVYFEPGEISRELAVPQGTYAVGPEGFDTSIRERGGRRVAVVRPFEAIRARVEPGGHADADIAFPLESVVRVNLAYPGGRRAQKLYVVWPLPGRADRESHTIIPAPDVLYLFWSRVIVGEMHFAASEMAPVTREVAVEPGAESALDVTFEPFWVDR
jgi:hypothetical protein